MKLHCFIGTKILEIAEGRSTFIADCRTIFAAKKLPPSISGWC
jgi:hypothetical protein